MSCLEMSTQLSFILNTLGSQESLHSSQFTAKRVVFVYKYDGEWELCLVVYSLVSSAGSCG